MSRMPIDLNSLADLWLRSTGQGFDMRQQQGAMELQERQMAAQAARDEESRRRFDVGLSFDRERFNADQATNMARTKLQQDEFNWRQNEAAMGDADRIFEQNRQDEQRLQRESHDPYRVGVVVQTVQSLRRGGKWDPTTGSETMARQAEAQGDPGLAATWRRLGPTDGSDDALARFAGTMPRSDVESIGLLHGLDTTEDKAAFDLAASMAARGQDPSPLFAATSKAKRETKERKAKDEADAKKSLRDAAGERQKFVTARLDRIDKLIEQALATLEAAPIGSALHTDATNRLTALRARQQELEGEQAEADKAWDEAWAAPKAEAAPAEGGERSGGVSQGQIDEALHLYPAWLRTNGLQDTLVNRRQYAASRGAGPTNNGTTSKR